MNEDKTPINEVFKGLKISKATLYNRLRKLDITPIKEGKNSYLSNEQIDKIKQYKQSKNNKDLLDNKEIRRLRVQLEREQSENKKLIQELGQWQGRAKTFEEQNNKLLIIEVQKKEKGFFARLFNLKN